MPGQHARSADQKRACPNCGQPTGPRFCGHCGQPVDDRRRPLVQILRELLSDWLSLDGRLLRSLFTLPRPGRLTLLHRDGKRAPYLRPLRLYLLASLALFSTVLTLEPPDATLVNLYIGGELVSKASASENVQRDIQIVKADSFFGNLLMERGKERFERFRELPPQQLLDSLFRYMRRYLPAALILFVPFLAAGLKLLYLRTGTLYLDHLVFALHFQSALFFALVTSWLVTQPLRLGLGFSLLVYVLTALLMMTVYLGLALRRVYRQRRWWTAVKALLLAFIYSQLMGFSLGLAVVAAIWQS